MHDLSHTNVSPDPHSFGPELAPPIAPLALISPLPTNPPDLTCKYIMGRPLFELTGGVVSIKGLASCHYVAGTSRQLKMT